MRLQKRLIIKTLLLGLTFAILIKWLGIERRTYLNSELVCPSFGNLPTLRVPKKSILIDSTDSIQKIAILNKSGEKKLYPLEYLDGAMFLRDKNKFQEFLAIYSDICGGKPTFYNSIDFVKLNRLKKIEHKRYELARSRTEFNEWGKFYAKEKRLQSDRAFLEKRISFLQNKLMHITPVTFQVIGKVAETTNNSLIVFGSAIPNTSSTKDSAGFVYNGIIILKNARKSDIVSPSFYETKHVLAKDFHFVKRIDGRDIFGHYMPVSVYDRTDKVPNYKILSEIKREISLCEKKLISVHKELKSLERIEVQLLATAM